MDKVELKKLLSDSFWIMPATPKFIDSGVSYITSKNIKNGVIEFDTAKSISEEDFLRISKKRPIIKDDILVSMIGTLGEAAIVKKEYDRFYGQNVYLLRLDNSLLNHNFFLFFLRSLTAKRHLEGQMNQSTQRYLKAEHVESLMLPCVDIKKQYTIVEELSRLDSIIDLKKKQLQEYDKLIKSRFVEMFGDVRENSKGLKSKPGKELFKFSSGKFLSKEKRLDSGLPVYGGNGITWYTNEALVNYSTIVIGRVGAYCGNVHIVKEPIWITDNAIFIKEFYDDSFNLDFLYEMMKVIDFSRFADYSGQPKITQKPLENIEYLIPKKTDQESFSRFMQQVDKLKFEVRKSLEVTQTLFDSLMQEYFN